MKALRFAQFGLENLRVEDLPAPVRDDGEVLVEVHAASINPSDVKNVQGRMQQTTLPRTPGRDFAGIVVAGPAELKGKSVWGSGGDLGFTRDGTHAEVLAIPREAVAESPAALSMEQASSVGVNYLAAWLGLIGRAQLRRGETVMITGVSGGVGSSVAKIARTLDATIIGVDRKPPSHDTIDELGLAVALGSETDDVPARVKDFTGGKGVNVVFDAVGGALFETCLKCLGADGRQVNIASVPERRVSFDLIDFYHRRLALFGVDTLALNAAQSTEILNSLKPLFESGKLTAPAIAQVCPLDDGPEAYKAVDQGKIKGKIVLRARVQLRRRRVRRRTCRCAVQRRHFRYTPARRNLREEANPVEAIFNIISNGNELQAGDARELHERGWVVLRKALPSDRIERVVHAYDAAISSAHPDDVRAGSTSTRVTDFVNRGADRWSLRLPRPAGGMLSCHRPRLQAELHELAHGAGALPGAGASCRCAPPFGGLAAARLHLDGRRVPNRQWRTRFVPGHAPRGRRTGRGVERCPDGAYRAGRGVRPRRLSDHF
jgi:NADPH2:quinone reductase